MQLEASEVMSLKLPTFCMISERISAGIVMREAVLDGELPTASALGACVCEPELLSRLPACLDDRLGDALISRFRGTT